MGDTVYKDLYGHKYAGNAGRIFVKEYQTSKYFTHSPKSRLIGPSWFQHGFILIPSLTNLDIWVVDEIQIQ